MFTKDELYILNEGLIRLMADASQAQTLVRDKASKDVISAEIKKYSELLQKCADIAEGME